LTWTFLASAGAFSIPARLPKAPASAAAPAEGRPRRSGQGPARRGRFFRAGALEGGKSVPAGRNPWRELQLPPRAARRRVSCARLRGARVQKSSPWPTRPRQGPFPWTCVSAPPAFLHASGRGGRHRPVEYADLDALIAAVAYAPLPVLLARTRCRKSRQMGAIARTAWALAAAGLIVPRHGGALRRSEAMRASAGACTICPWPASPT
jgi:23S rRNA (guanosine2251-2'-O)-methyltransferase